MNVEVKFSPRQTKAWETLEHPDTMVALYGGAKGGGKSVFGCWWLLLKCLQIIERFNLKHRKYPLPLGFMGRKQGVDLEDTTLETWKKFIPENVYEMRRGDREIVIQGAVKIQYGGFDDKNTIKKFNSAEYGYAFVDQAEEISRDDYGLLRGTLRLRVNNEPIDYKVLLTANPDVCWLKDEFITSLPAHGAFIQALPADNPFLPESYVDNLKEAFKHRPELVEAYVYGSWDLIAGSNLVIKPSWVEKSINRELKEDVGRVAIACDPARFGDDETVIYVFRDEKIIDQMIYGQRSTMETAGYLSALKNKHKARLIAVDAIGVGAGIVDRLRELKEPVLEINSSAGFDSDSPDKKKYINLRAKMYWEAGEKIADEKVSIKDDMTLRRQLVNVQYKIVSGGRVQIESKEDIKERASNKSPDRADAFVMGLYALDKVSYQKRDFDRINQRNHFAFAGAGSPSGYGWQR